MPEPGRHLSVRLRVSLAAVISVGVVLALASFAIVRIVDDRLLDSVRQEAVRTLEGTSFQIPFEAAPGQFVSVVPGRPAVAVVPATGVGALPAVPADVLGGSAAGISLVREEVRGQASIVGYAALPDGNRVLVTVVSLEEALSTVRGLRQALWIGVPILVGLVGLLAWVLVGKALRPVERIRCEVDEISHGTLHRRVRVPLADDEVAHLAETMNGMLDRLDAAAAQQRQFVSDASHELRNPLATIRATVEVAATHPERADWPLVSGVVMAETDRLGSLVDDLIALARLDEGEPMADEEVDLDEVVLAEVGRVRSAGLTVDVSGVGAARLRGDRRLLERSVRNLLDNAVRHARGRIWVVLRRDAADVVLTVDDDGPGIPPADRERVFERFARLDEARARDQGGSGLGLALVRAVAERHGGTARAVDAPYGGARFQLRLRG
jgi:signal transduction histidine kinase